jgi:phosphoglycerate dehydrogenase-like enzyme
LPSDSTNVCILTARPGAGATILGASLPGDWSVAEAPQAPADTDYVVVWDSTADAAALGDAARVRRVIHVADGGGDVDDAACARRGIPVEVIDSLTSITVAEHAITSMLMLLKRIPQASELLRAGKIAGDVAPARTSQTSYAYNWVGLDRWEALYGQAVGLVGLGGIGTIVAQRLRCFGAAVSYAKPSRLDPAREAELGVRHREFDELLRTSSCLSLHNRHTPETERMMGAAEFAAMPPGAIFVNTARGGLVDEDALVDALTSGHLAGAALDVFDLEPLPPDSPLLGAPNLLLTPHVAGIPVGEVETIALRQAARLMIADAAR